MGQNIGILRGSALRNRREISVQNKERQGSPSDQAVHDACNKDNTVVVTDTGEAPRKKIEDEEELARNHKKKSEASKG